MTETSSHRYKPRNIINAPNVKSSIFSRSQQRGDSENIQRWLDINRMVAPKYPALVKQPFLSLDHR
ncbi:Putative cytoplasmic protein [Salmonella enterica subsp. enterica serovar Montevideo str. S5-403]|uniref:Putative cytoplasmic protein n=1 Tax=Salmonella enterica subsp. enterica serovar Montevideo str. S5-403 TaxID=913242 RepID=G5Q4M9_SALMO|nr:Putative cytoplasmic protein [Salmonella enterica subsp. enterica serovar Montevideo str. S5-403]